MFSFAEFVDLPLIWYGLIMTAMFLYVILDGFDLGVGILFPFAPSESCRDRMMNSIAPFWDGNETWLVLGVRVLGEVREEYLEPLAKADHIFIEELRAHGLYDKVSQAFAVFLPVKSVGVVGDQRRYEWVIALRAVETIDFMTAIWSPLPYEFLEKVSLRIINEISGVSRVVYDISGKPPATIEWE